VLSEGKLLAFRDPHGFRPLVIGRLGDDDFDRQRRRAKPDSAAQAWVVSSETCALDLLGAEFEREVGRGELLVVDEAGVESVQAVEEAAGGALCIFESFYFCRPDSYLAGVETHGARVRMGERLAVEAPADADLV